MARRPVGPGRAEGVAAGRLLDIARDHPETVGVLEQTLVPVGEWGRVTLDSLPGSADLVEWVVKLTAWRGKVRESLGT